jgi:hypothetical protein
MYSIYNLSKRIYLSRNIQSKVHVPQENKGNNRNNGEEGPISAKVSISDQA